MRKIRKTAQKEIVLPVSPELREVAAPPSPASGESLPAAMERPAGSARERVHYLGAVCHASPPLLVVESEPMNEAGPARAAFSGRVRLRARETVRNCTLAACGVGLIPLPLADVAGTALIIGRMLGAVSELYGCPGVTWSKTAGLSVLAALGAAGGGGIAAGLLLRLIPGGGLLASAALPASMGVVTYALGMATIRCYEKSGASAPPPLDALLLDIRGNWTESGRRVAELYGRDGIRVKA